MEDEDRSRHKPVRDYRKLHSVGTTTEGEEPEKSKVNKNTNKLQKKMADDKAVVEEGELREGEPGSEEVPVRETVDLMQKASDLAEKAATIDPEDPEFEKVLQEMSENEQQMKKEADRRAKMAAMQEKLADLEQTRVRLQMARQNEEKARQERAEGYEFTKNLLDLRNEAWTKDLSADRKARGQFQKVTDWYADAIKQKNPQSCKATMDEFELLKELSKDKNLEYCARTGVAKLKSIIELDTAEELLGAAGGESIKENATENKSFNELFRDGGVDKLAALGFGKWDDGEARTAFEAMPKPWQKKLRDSKAPVDENGESSDSDNCCSCKHKSKSNKSGRLDKPSTNVKTRLHWPHMFQNKRYVTKAHMFEELTFELFVGGETRIILNSRNPEERYGRLRILEQCAYWVDKSRDWQQVRGIYTAILESIEVGDARWTSDFSHYDSLITRVNKIQEKGDKSKVKKGNDLFCRDYNRNECSITAPHRAWVKGEMKKVLHCCANCLRKDREIKPHPQTDRSCPHYRTESQI